MKIRSLLLGSVAAAGLSTAGFAADLGVVTALDVCDELGISGLTISSDDNCLAISGGVETMLAIFDNGGGMDWESSWGVWIDFTATAPTDFGPATAYIKLESSNNGPDYNTLDVAEAWVSVGDTTVVTAGYKSSLYDSDLDAPEGAFDFETGVGLNDGITNFSAIGEVIGFQVTSAVADGFSIGGALEHANTNNALWGVGVVSYQGSGIAAEGHVAVDLGGTAGTDWLAYGAFQGYFDPITVAASIEAEAGGYWEGFLGAAVTVDMFTLSGSIAADSTSYWIANGKVEAGVTDEVTVYIKGSYDDLAVWTGAVGVDASVTETLAANAEIGTDNSGANYYATAGLTWTPGGDTEFSVDGTAYDTGDYRVEFNASKDFQ